MDMAITGVYMNPESQEDTFPSVWILIFTQLETRQKKSEIWVTVTPTFTDILTKFSPPTLVKEARKNSTVTPKDSREDKVENLVTDGWELLKEMEIIKDMIQ